MNSSPVETMEGAAAIFTFANDVGTLKTLFWAMCVVLAVVVVSSIIHEIKIGSRVSRRRDR